MVNVNGLTFTYLLNIYKKYKIEIFHKDQYHEHIWNKYELNTNRI